MSVVTITKCNSVKATMKYLFEKQKKNKFRERVGAVYCSLGSVDDFCKCAAELNETFQRIEGYNIVQSFEKDEFDINNPEDVQTVNDFGFELAQRLYKNSPFVVVTHIDANSGCIHNHITVLNHNFETNKCITENRQFKQISYVNDMLMKENNLNVCKPNKLKNLDDTLKLKLDEAISRTDNFDDFVTLLNTEYAISVDAYDKKHQIKKSLSYHYTDSNGKQRKRRSSSISDNYTVESILSRLNANMEHNKAIAVSEPVKANMEPVNANMEHNKAIAVSEPVKANMEPVNANMEHNKATDTFNNTKEWVKNYFSKQNEIKLNEKLSRDYDITNQNRETGDDDYQL